MVPRNQQRQAFVFFPFSCFLYAPQQPPFLPLFFTASSNFFWQTGLQNHWPSFKMPFPFSSLIPQMGSFFLNSPNTIFLTFVFFQFEHPNDCYYDYYQYYCSEHIVDDSPI